MRSTESPTELYEFKELCAGLLMQRDVITCRPTDSGGYIASKLTELNFGSLPVVDDIGYLVGLVSEFDLLKVLKEGWELEAIRAEDIMTRDIKVIHEGTPVHEILQLMEANHLIRLPVVKEGQLVGIVARRDILFGYIKSTATYLP